MYRLSEVNYWHFGRLHLRIYDHTGSLAAQSVRIDVWWTHALYISDSFWEHILHFGYIPKKLANS